jgi:bacteriorhodopsin
MNIVFVTLWVSIFLQIFTGALDLVVLLNPVEPHLQLIHHLLFGELVVQVVEASFYVYWASKFTQISNITPQRYVDWMITTPTMLITLILYSIYLGHKAQNKDTTDLNAIDLMYTYRYPISQIVGLNALMLVFGYLGEIHKLPVTTSVFLGFIPFVLYYAIIYREFSSQSEEGIAIFYYFVVFWSLYGVAALCSYTIKNAMYNILDIFAKNFFGLFLVYVIVKH